MFIIDFGFNVNFNILIIMSSEKMIPIKKKIFNVYRGRNEELWGYCNLKGEILIYPRFSSVSNFNTSGIATVNYKVESKYNIGSDVAYFGALIDIKGDEFNKIPYKRLGTENLNGGILASQEGVLAKEKTFFIDIEENNFDFFFDGFNDGIIVYERYIEFKKHILISKNSKVFFQSDKYSIIFRIDTDQFLGKRTDGYLNKFDLFNSRGERLEVSSLSIKNKKEFGIQIYYYTKNRHLNINEKFGFINSEGEVIIQFDLDFLSPFYRGVAKFRKGQKLGLITKSGEVILEENNILIEFSGPLQSWRLIKDGGVFFLDENQNYFLESFQNSFGLNKEVNIIPVCNGTEIKSSFMNEYGIQMFSISIEKIKELTKNFVLYESEGKMGGMTLQGVCIFKPIYESINYLHKDIFLIKDGDFVQVVSISLGGLIKLNWMDLSVFSGSRYEHLKYNLNGYSLYINYSLKICEIYANLFDDKNPIEIFTFDGKVIGEIDHNISYPNIDYLLGEDFNF